MKSSNADPHGTEAGVAALPPMNRASDGTGHVSAAAIPARRPTRLRAFVSELRAAWRGPATPPPVPRIVDYPVRRRP
jgi:hypothetical protein